MRKPKRRIGVAIDMTPMVDVAFLLLIFFMTTTSFKPPEEVTIELPVSHAKYKVPDTDVLILTITQDSQVFSQLGTHDPMKRIDKSQVFDTVKGERSKRTGIRVIVKADRDCPYGTMQEVMDQLQAANATRFVLMTEGEAGGAGEIELPTDEELEKKALGEVGALFGDPSAPAAVQVAARVGAPEETN